jgi:signal transduction histidine kinase
MSTGIESYQTRIMTKPLILLFVFAVLVFPSTLLAQKQEIDSLLSIVSKTKNDTSKVNALNSLSREFLRAAKTDEAKKYANEALSLSRKISFKKGEAQSHAAFADIYWKQWNFTDTYINLYAALNISIEIEDYSAIASSHFMLGNVYYYDGNYPEALKQWLSSLAIYSREHSVLGIADCNNNIAGIYLAQKKYKEALIYLETSLKSYEEIQNKHRIALVLINIGEIYGNLGDYTKALEKFDLCLNVSYEIKNKGLVALARQNLGKLEYIQAENEINIQEKEKHLQEGLKFVQAGLNDFNPENGRDEIARSYLLIGLISIGLKKYADAKPVLNQSLSLAKELNIKELIRDNYKALTSLDSIDGNWLQAFKNQRLYISYRDSLLNQESNEKIIRLQMQYKFDKKEDSLKHQQELAEARFKQQVLLTNQQKQSLLLQENQFTLLSTEKELRELQLRNSQTELAAQVTETEKKQSQLLILNKEKDIQSLQIQKQVLFRNYLLIGLALLIIAASFAYYSYRTRQQLRLQMLRNKIASDLHDDVGSTLSSISMFSQMAQQQSKENIPLLDTIGDHSRKILDAMADIVWTINPENDQFEQIILRMRNFAYDLLGTKNIEFEFDADDNVSNKKLSMDVKKNIYLIFKEATNNMIKYSGADKASFSIRGKKNTLTMLIHDNGKGFDTSQQSTGMGLRNMRYRAEEIGASLMINSKKGMGTTIELCIAV